MSSKKEVITVYKFLKVPNSYAGFNEVVELQADAPVFANITERRGDDVRISERMASEFLYRVETNIKTGFSFTRDMYLSTRFGAMSITGIREDVRKRSQILDASMIGTIGAETGTGATGGAIRIYYRRGVDGATAYTLTQGVGKDLIAFDRDGIGREPRDGDATENLQVNWDSETGTVTLLPGDIFYSNELLTFWVQ